MARHLEIRGFDLLRSALNLGAREVRCSSVEGYRLPGGASVADQLRTEVQAEVFVGLLSEHSLRSSWVLFELGARWGSGRLLIPLLTGGARASDLQELPGPIGGLNALSATEAGQLHQFIAEMGRGLRIEPEDASVYQEKVERFTRAE